MPAELRAVRCIMESLPTDGNHALKSPNQQSLKRYVFISDTSRLPNHLTLLLWESYNVRATFYFISFPCNCWYQHSILPVVTLRSSSSIYFSKQHITNISTTKWWQHYWVSVGAYAHYANYVISCNGGRWSTTPPPTLIWLNYWIIFPSFISR